MAYARRLIAAEFEGLAPEEALSDALGLLGLVALAVVGFWAAAVL